MKTLMIYLVAIVTASALTSQMAYANTHAEMSTAPETAQSTEQEAPVTKQKKHRGEFRTEYAKSFVAECLKEEEPLLDAQMCTCFADMLVDNLTVIQLFRQKKVYEFMEANAHQCKPAWANDLEAWDS